MLSMICFARQQDELSQDSCISGIDREMIVKVSANGRHLVTEDGSPFFYLADTAWNLFYHVGYEDAVRYVDNRHEKGFSVIMPCLIREGGIANAVNEYGDKPFVNDDPKKPNESFFRHVDRIIDYVDGKGMYVALLPTWGEYVGPLNGRPGPILFDMETARVYGRFLGERYGKRDVIWVLGGDRNPDSLERIEVYRAFAAGIKEGDGGRNLMTFHPAGQHSSSEWFQDEPWLDFHMMQTGTFWDLANETWIWEDYNREPAKPVLDGETRYENSHEVFSAPYAGRKMTPHQVRKAAYNAVLAGALGHTYGCRDVWDCYVPGVVRPTVRDTDTDWRVAMDFPGGWQVGIMARFFAHYHWYELEPDQEHRLVPQARRRRKMGLVSAMSYHKEFGLIYVPERMRVAPDISALSATTITARWFNPASGFSHYIGEFTRDEPFTVDPPELSESPDHVLILEKSA